MIGSRTVGFFIAFSAPLTVAAFGAACGARSDLLLRDSVTPEEAGPADDAPTPNDAQPIEDRVPPGLDVALRDVTPIPACADASDTLIYTVTETNTLLKFDPGSAQFTVIGSLACPDPFGRDPFSMAVDRQGNAYVLYFQRTNDGTPPQPGSIFKVNLNNADCVPSGFVPGQQGFDGFGMGFASNDVGGGETLYVASGDTTPGRLGGIDEKSLVLSVVGSLPSDVANAELTGTGDGRLFAFFATPDGLTAIGEIDKTNANVIGQTPLPQITLGAGWAFAFWGGSFYTFTAPNGTTTEVDRYDPVTGNVTEVATYPEIIDGAGVSTCAPVQ